MSNQTENGGAADEFGANEWMVEELYERFVVDRYSVDPNWWPTLEKYPAKSGFNAPEATATRAVAAAPLTTAPVTTALVTTAPATATSGTETKQFQPLALAAPSQHLSPLTLPLLRRILLRRN